MALVFFLYVSLLCCSLLSTSLRAETPPPDHDSTCFPSYTTNMKSPYSMAKPTGCLDPGATKILVREVWQGKEDADGLSLRFDMPGVGSDNFTVGVDKDTLVMEGKGEKDFEKISDDDKKFGPVYHFTMQLLEIQLFNTSALEANTVNGVLKVFVPKFK